MTTNARCGCYALLPSNLQTNQLHGVSLVKLLLKIVEKNLLILLGDERNLHWTKKLF